MLITDKMLENGFTGAGEHADMVGEFVNGKLHGLAVTKEIAGEFSDGKVSGYNVDTDGNIKHIDTLLVESLPFNNLWIGGEFGIFVTDSGKTRTGLRADILPKFSVTGPVVLTQDRVYKKINMVDLKNLQIDFTGWYCPVYRSIFNINPEGQIHSGVCGNVYHTTPNNPWWTLDKLEINADEICNLARGNCFCDSDLYHPKAVDKDTFDYFQKNKPPACEFDLLPTVEDTDTIVAMSNRFQDAGEVHFHIGKRCNYDCAYCPSEIHDNFSKDLSFENFKKCLELLEPHVPAHRRIFLTGGEPTLNKQLLDFVNHASDLNYIVYVSTNGTASKKALMQLMDAGAKLHISFHVEFTNNKLLQKVAELIPQYGSQMELKVMAYADKPFAKKVQEILPDSDLHYFPIYGRDLEHTYYRVEQDDED